MSSNVFKTFIIPVQLLQHAGTPHTTSIVSPDVAQDVLRLRQQCLVEGRAGEVAQLVLAVARAAVLQGFVIGLGALGGEGGLE